LIGAIEWRKLEAIGLMFKKLFTLTIKSANFGK
jgi:hypothetical protein